MNGGSNNIANNNNSRRLEANIFMFEENVVQNFHILLILKYVCAFCLVIRIDKKMNYLLVDRLVCCVTILKNIFISITFRGAWGISELRVKRDLSYDTNRHLRMERKLHLFEKNKKKNKFMFPLCSTQSQTYSSSSTIFMTMLNLLLAFELGFLGIIKANICLWHEKKVNGYNTTIHT